SREGGAVDEMEPAPMSDVAGTVATFTIDRIAYSPSPPIVFAVVDFDGGGRPPIELTDVEADDLAIGDRVEMTFRRLFSADGIHNYFWKARPIRSAPTPESEARTMGSHGIKDKVAIVGMSCLRFGEHFDKSIDDLLLDASLQCFDSTGVTKDDIDAYWLGTGSSGNAGITLARPLKLKNKPVTP